MQSHPTWVRGLKQDKNCAACTTPNVAPYVGAWIETLIAAKSILAHRCRTLRGCVD